MMTFSKRLMNIMGAVIAGTAFLLLTSASHVSAVSMSSHEMSSMNHASVKSASCVTVCVSALVENGQKLKHELDEEEDEPFPYTTDVPLDFSGSENQSPPENSLAWPLLKVPLHVLYEVYRN